MPNQAATPARASTPDIGELTHANIESILCLEERERRSKPWAYRAVNRVAAFCGTVQFLWINLGIFAAWIGVNEFVARFDPYPFTFLLFLVSLEAIFLSVLILISQNMASEENERRHHLDLQINLLNEREMSTLLRLVARMADHMGLEDEASAEADALAKPTDPARVLHDIVSAESAHAR